MRYYRSMFSHLRYLALVSLALILAGSAAFGHYFLRMKEREIQAYSESSVRSLLSGFEATIWARYSPAISTTPKSPYLSSFQEESRKYFKELPLNKITVFSTDLENIDADDIYFWSTHLTVTRDGASDRVTLFDLGKVQAGTSVSQLLKTAYLTGEGGDSKPRSMVQMIVPLKSAEGKVTALAEIYTDVSPAWDKLTEQLTLLGGGFIGLFTLLSVVMLFTSSRAENVITKQHEVNLELIAAAAQAEAQSRDKSQFLASVSHELRTPLNAIIGFSDIVRSESKDRLDKTHQEYLDDINASGKHLLSLINDILDFSKAEAGKLQIEWAETDATKVIRNSLRMVLPRAEAAQVTLNEDIPPQHLVVVTDAKKLKQVLLNLMSNAVKFTPAGGEVSCSAWVDVVTGGLTIQVRDTGIGIAPKDISRVMTPFGQVDSALSRKYEGTGLGLPLSKKFIESMGGTFIIESELKKGTNVTISIPKQPPGWGTSAMNAAIAAGTAHVASAQTA